MIAAMFHSSDTFCPFDDNTTLDIRFEGDTVTLIRQKHWTTAGMIGIGGGIVLSPLMLLMRWATLKETAAVSALFIFVNSLSGLFGQINKGGIHLTDNLQYAVFATIFGGLLGSYFGSQKFNVPTLKYLLALGLTIASLKLMFT